MADRFNLNTLPSCYRPAECRGGHCWLNGDGNPTARMYTHGPASHRPLKPQAATKKEL